MHILYHAVIQYAKNIVCVIKVVLSRSILYMYSLLYIVLYCYTSEESVLIKGLSTQKCHLVQSEIITTSTQCSIALDWPLFQCALKSNYEK